MAQFAATPVDVAAILVVLAALFGYLNYRFIGLPHSIGLIVMGAVASLVVVLVDVFLPAFSLGHSVRGFLRGIDFQTALMDGMLAFLLFAGALHVDLPLLLRRVSAFAPGTFPILVWGGLRGGISVALALSLPDGAMRELIVTVTYVVVLFSVIVQGATVGTAARRFVGDAARLEAE